MCPTGTTLLPKQNSVNATSEFREAFTIMDSDKDGKISSDDLRSFYALSKNSGDKSEEEMIKAMINVADANKDGFVQYDEFEVVVSNKVEINGGLSEDFGVMEEVFKVMDKDCDGKLGFLDLKSYLGITGINVDDEEINNMIMLGGGNVSDGVDFHGFLTILDLHN